MNKIKALFKIILLNIAVCASLSIAAMGVDQSNLVGLRYGPNLSWGGMVNTPLVWGQWVPQMNLGVRYTWLEPLGEMNYGTPLGLASAYLKMDASVEVSPFYGGYRAGLGLRPFKVNPQVEFNFIYESYFYFKSNLEMVNADVKGNGRIAETWNSDYIFDNVGKSDTAEFDYAQLFDMSINLSYTFSRGSIIGVVAHYVLSDISTDFDGKSYDYKLNMPVFSRDFILDFEFFGRAPISENVALLVETSLFRTGFLRNGDVVEKEALSYMMVRLGPHISWKEGLRCVTLEIGFWNRLKDRFYDGSLAQQFIVQLQYQGYFSFPIHKDAR